MELMGSFYHEGQAQLKASTQRRHAKYGGEQKADTMFDLSEPTIPGVLTKKIVRPGDGVLAPIGAKVRCVLFDDIFLVTSYSRHDLRTLGLSRQWNYDYSRKGLG